MTWAREYQFAEPLIDLRDRPGQAQALESELRRELSPGHPLHGCAVRVIARALPQDDVIVEAEQTVALVHLTWSRKAETPPWPTTELLTSAQHLEAVIEDRY